MCAASYGHLDILNLLLKHRARLDFQDQVCIAKHTLQLIHAS